MTSHSDSYATLRRRRTLGARVRRAWRQRVEPIAARLAFVVLMVLAGAAWYVWLTEG